MARLQSGRACFEAPGLAAGLDDMAVMSEPVKHGSGHLDVAADTAPLGKRQIGDRLHLGRSRGESSDTQTRTIGDNFETSSTFRVGHEN